MEEQHDDPGKQDAEETIRDLDVPGEDADDVTGGGPSPQTRPDKV